jgi:endonuclease YncB( thermonuclease family)
MPGLLRVHGVIDLGQFWPRGSSDADTTKVQLLISKGSFEFRADGAKRFRKSKVFNDARVKAQGVRPAVRVAKKTGVKSIVVRLQGIDAPELHYQPRIPDSPRPTAAQRTAFNVHNDELRQAFGETCTVALHDRLVKVDSSGIEATMESLVDSPNEVCDVYGRFVGELTVKTGGATLRVAQWLLSHGWALPAYYNSMTIDEIEELNDATTRGRAKGRIWANYSAKIGALDEARRYRPDGEIDADGDVGALILPKLFRRQANYAIARKYTDQVLPETFSQFVSTGAGNQMHRTDDFVLQGAAAARIEYLGQNIRSNRLTLEPEQIVFRERPSLLIDSEGNPVTRW